MDEFSRVRSLAAVYLGPATSPAHATPPFRRRRTLLTSLPTPSGGGRLARLRMARRGPASLMEAGDGANQLNLRREAEGAHARAAPDASSLQGPPPTETLSLP